MEISGEHGRINRRSEGESGVGLASMEHHDNLNPSEMRLMISLDGENNEILLRTI